MPPTARRRCTPPPWRRPRKSRACTAPASRPMNGSVEPSPVPMETTPLNGIASPASDTTALTNAASRTLDRDDFLLMLVTQLQNQDPLNPLQGHEFAAQLAQFSSVEQLTNINEAIKGSQEANNLLAQSINSGVAAGLIGKEIDALGNELGWIGEPVRLGFELPRAAASVEVQILDDTGKTVRTFDLGKEAGGLVDLTWDGTDGNGNVQPNGRYTFEVTAVDASGEAIGIDNTYTRGTVDRISFSSEGIRLWIDDLPVSMSSVLTVRNPS
ncbi:hypothetical protein AWN76_017555 [Rhodothermaceae bacterium RA]|nr:hypothetical protein AWN76_017555 [Rhodothermaceae bacterium RA]